jgi:hypothetical protein
LAGHDGTTLITVPPPLAWNSDDSPLTPTDRRLAAQGVVIEPRTAPVWDGTPLNLGWAIDVMRN